MDRGPRDIHILPNGPGLRNANAVNDYAWVKNIHPALRRDDGIPYLVIHRAGEYLYRKEVDDPFYAAHTPTQGRPIQLDFSREARDEDESRRDYNPNYKSYYADYEATALGCLDQYQFCITDLGFCTSWGHGEEQISAMRLLLDERDRVSLADLWVFALAHERMPVYEYLLGRQGNYKPMPLTQSDLINDRVNGEVAHSGRGMRNATRDILPWRLPNHTYKGIKELWVAEVETWFTKATLETILTAQEGARQDIYYPAYPKKDQSTSSRHRILFRNSNYTNINWIGLWVITTLFTLLSVASYATRWLDKTTRMMLKRAVTVVNCIRKKLAIAAKTLKSVLLLWGLRKSSRVWRTLSSYWTRHFGSRFISVTTWFDRHEPQSSVYGSNFDDTEPAAASVALEDLMPR
jgi:hypothetical protein